MKNPIVFLLLSLVFLLSSCEAEDIDEKNRLYHAEMERLFQQNYNNFLDQSVPKMEGKWRVIEMNTLELNSQQVDSVLYDVGEIELKFTDISHESKRLKNYHLNGVFHINNLSIPFYSSYTLATYEANLCHITVEPQSLSSFLDKTLSEDDIKTYDFVYDHFIHENLDLELVNNGAILILRGTSKKNKKIILSKIQ